MDRRGFLGAIGSAAVVGTLASCDRLGAPARRGAREAGRWGDVQDRFLLDPEYVHLAGMLVAPHPDVVREAIERHRAELDRNPALYVGEEFGRLQRRSRSAAAEHMGARTDDVGLTDSTTMGIGLMYSGIRIQEGQEFLTTHHDYHATHDAVEYRAAATGAQVRYVSLFDDVMEASAGSLVDRTISAIRDGTRVLALTWVHSSTGLKLPVREIAGALEEVNAGRDEEERVLFCLDGVHGLGVEDTDIPELGCDFFFAGTHKWVFGPRGTGVVWGRPELQEQVAPTVPTFTRDGSWGGLMTPGGFKPFEHQWAMAEAFEFLREAGGRDEIQSRIHSLAGRLKEGLLEMEGVLLRTPRSPELSSGVVCFDVEGVGPRQVVEGLLQRGVIASVTPYENAHARFSPGLNNSEEEMERALAALREIA